MSAKAHATGVYFPLSDSAKASKTHMYEELAAALLCTHWTGGKRIPSGELQGFAMQQLLQSLLWLTVKRLFKAAGI